MRGVRKFSVVIGSQTGRGSGCGAVISPEQVGERYLTVHHRMRRAVDDGMADCGLSLARTKILRYLCHDPARPSVLAAALGVAPHTITDVVDALERDHLVARQPDPSDRRAKLVALTGAGEAALTVASGTRQRLLTQVFGALDPDDRAVMMRLLDVLDGAAAALISCPGQEHGTREHGLRNPTTAEQAPAALAPSKP
jgi:DNA-binding MarR family transcriptional regulator